MRGCRGRIAGNWERQEHRQKLAEQGVESDGGEEEHQTSAAAPSVSANAAGAKVFGQRGDRILQLRNMKVCRCQVYVVSHQFQTKN